MWSNFQSSMEDVQKGAFWIPPWPFTTRRWRSSQDFEFQSFFFLNSTGSLKNDFSFQKTGRRLCKVGKGSGSSWIPNDSKNSYQMRYSSFEDTLTIEKWKTCKIPGKCNGVHQMGARAVERAESSFPIWNLKRRFLHFFRLEIAIGGSCVSARVTARTPI